MFRQKALELFNQGKIQESKKIFLEILQTSDDFSHILCALEHLERIHVKKYDANLAEHELDILKKYLKRDEANKFLEVYRRIQKKTLSIERIYLDFLWKRKELSKFDTVAQNLSSDILINKNFVGASEFYDWIKSIRKYFLYPHFGSLIMSLEIQSFQSAVCDIETIVDLLDNKWSKVENKKKSQKDYYLHLKNIINRYDLNQADLLKKKHELDIKTSIICGDVEKFQKKQIIEYLIAFSKEPEKLSLLVPILKDSQRKLLISYVTNLQKNFNFSSESPFKKILKDYFVRTKKVKITKNNDCEYYPTHYHVEGHDENYDDEIFKKYSIEQDKDEVAAQKNFVSLMKLISHELTQEKLNIIVALIELRLYDAAYTLIAILEKTDGKTLNMQYLKLEIDFRKQSYSDVIVGVNEVLEANDTEQLQRIPFYYLKANSYLKLGKKEAAQNLFSVIHSYNPKFRLIKEKMFD